MTDEVGELAHTLNAMLASLERAQEAEHRFVGDASHELRTPLTALRGNAAYLAKHGPDEAVIQDIADGAERLTTLLDDLLALAREDAAAPLHAEPVRLADLVADARSIEHDVWVSGERDGAAARRRQPRPQRAQARQRQRHGDGRRRRHRRVHRRRGRRPGPGRPRPRSSSASTAARGARGEGSGLGLAIVKAIAERHGGRVEVDGARFTLVVKELSRSARRTGTQ